VNKTKIEWCDFTWNPVVGCTGACPYCYARKMAHRFHRDFTPHWVERNFNRAMPKKPSRIFVNSMSDVADWEPTWVQLVNGRMIPISDEAPRGVSLDCTRTRHARREHHGPAIP
jgi:protein gp37